LDGVSPLAPVGGDTLCPIVREVERDGCLHLLVVVPSGADGGHTAVLPLAPLVTPPPRGGRRLEIRTDHRRRWTLNDQDGTVIGTWGLQSEATQVARRVLRLTGGEVVYVRAHPDAPTKVLRVQPTVERQEPPRMPR
jgi:hypothetical protein